MSVRELAESLRSEQLPSSLLPRRSTLRKQARRLLDAAGVDPFAGNSSYAVVGHAYSTRLIEDEVAVSSLYTYASLPSDLSPWLGALAVDKDIRRVHTILAWTRFGLTPEQFVSWSTVAWSVNGFRLCAEAYVAVHAGCDHYLYDALSRRLSKGARGKPVGREHLIGCGELLVALKVASLAIPHDELIAWYQGGWDVAAVVRMVGVGCKPGLARSIWNATVGPSDRPPVSGVAVVDTIVEVAAGRLPYEWAVAYGASQHTSRLSRPAA